MSEYPETRTVRLRCPCCERATIEVTLVRSDRPEDPAGWTFMDDRDPDTACCCPEYMSHMQQHADQYRDDLFALALEAIDE